MAVLLLNKAFFCHKILKRNNFFVNLGDILLKKSNKMANR